jgi:hypothetical protein
MAPDSEIEARIEKAVARAGLRAEPWTEGATTAAAQAEERRRRIQSWLTGTSGALSALAFAIHAWLDGGVIAAFEAGEHGLGSTPLPSKVLYSLAVLCAVRYVRTESLARRQTTPTRHESTDGCCSCRRHRNRGVVRSSNCPHSSSHLLWRWKRGAWAGHGVQSPL